MAKPSSGRSSSSHWSRSCSYWACIWHSNTGFCTVRVPLRSPYQVDDDLPLYHCLSTPHPLTPTTTSATPLSLIDISIYLIVAITTIPSIFEDIYNESVGIGGLHYIALGMGLTLFSQLNARTMDKIYVYLTNKNGGVGRPEFRLRECFFPALIRLPTWRLP